MVDAFAVGSPDDLTPRFNIAPTQDVHCLLGDQSRGAVWRPLRWGLIPFWAKDPQIGNSIINARAETVSEKPSFRASYKSRRCVVLGTGFYEWRKDGAGKTPCYISREDQQPLAFAGLWDCWAQDDAKPVYTCTILTTGANRFMHAIHHRMPLILEPDQALTWIQGDTPQKDLDALAAHQPELPLQFWPVSKAVNSPRHDSRELVWPVSVN